MDRCDLLAPDRILAQPLQMKAHTARKTGMAAGRSTVVLSGSAADAAGEGVRE